MKLSRIFYGLGWLVNAGMLAWLLWQVAPGMVRMVREDPWSATLPGLMALGFASFLGAAWAQKRERKADDE